MAVSPEGSSSAREMQMVAAATVHIVRKVPVQLSSSLVIQLLCPFPTFCAPWLLKIYIFKIISPHSRHC